MPSEFDLIRRRFTHPTTHTDLAVGDDAALMCCSPGMQLVVSTDMLVAGTHFFADAQPYDIGWKTAAVNISDMAAMGAQARWIVLALSLPGADDVWTAAMASGFLACCQRFGVDWVGGDTTRGPLNLCATVFGEVPQGEAIVRSGARIGDDIWVSGSPGLAALGLQALQGKLALHEDARQACLERLHRPLPRAELGCALRQVATAMLDVSDGLAGDLRHILERSQVGADVHEAALPMAPLMNAGADPVRARQVLLSGGDDYELLFTAPPVRRGDVLALAAALDLPITRIGAITPAATVLQLVRPDGTQQLLDAHGYDHFSD